MPSVSAPRGHPPKNLLWGRGEFQHILFRKPFLICSYKQTLRLSSTAHGLVQKPC